MSLGGLNPSRKKSQMTSTRMLAAANTVCPKSQAIMGFSLISVFCLLLCTRVFLYNFKKLNNFLYAGSGLVDQSVGTDKCVPFDVTAKHAAPPPEPGARLLPAPLLALEGTRHPGPGRALPLPSWRLRRLPQHGRPCHCSRGLGRVREWKGTALRPERAARVSARPRRCVWSPSGGFRVSSVTLRVCELRSVLRFIL